jgi:hypothetical protein
VATIVDSLLITFGLDATEFKKGVKEVEAGQANLKATTGKNSKEKVSLIKKETDAQKRQTKDTNEGVKKSVDQFKQVRNQLLGIAALVTGGLGLVRFGSNTLSAAANVGRLAQNVGESVQTIAGLQGVFKNIGGSADEANTSILRANDSVQKFKTLGMADADITGFLRMGGDLEKTPINTGLDFLSAKADLIKKKIAEMGEPKAFAAASQFLGMSQNEFNALKGGSIPLKNDIGRLGKNSGLTEANTREAQRYKSSLNDLDTKLQGVTRTIFFAFEPALYKIMGAFEKLANWLIAHQGDITKWVDLSIKKVGEFFAQFQEFIGAHKKDIDGFLSGVNKVVEAIGGWKNVLLGLAAFKLTTLVAELTGVLSVVRGITGAAGLAGTALGGITLAGATGYGAGSLLYDNFISGTNFGDSLGKYVAFGLSLVGNKEAKAALVANGDFPKPVNSRLSQPAINSSTSNSTSSTNVNIDSIVIHAPNATDAQGIAKKLAPAIKSNIAPQANSGVVQ